MESPGIQKNCVLSCNPLPLIFIKDAHWSLSPRVRYFHMFYTLAIRLPTTSFFLLRGSLDHTHRTTHETFSYLSFRGTWGILCASTEFFKGGINFMKRFIFFLSPFHSIFLLSLLTFFLSNEKWN